MILFLTSGLMALIKIMGWGDPAWATVAFPAAVQIIFITIANVFIYRKV